MRSGRSCCHTWDWNILRQAFVSSTHCKSVEFTHQGAHCVYDALYLSYQTWCYNKPSNFVHLPLFIAFSFISPSVTLLRACLSVSGKERVLEFAGSPWQFCETLIKGDGPILNILRISHVLPASTTHTHITLWGGEVNVIGIKRRWISFWRWHMYTANKRTKSEWTKKQIIQFFCSFSSFVTRHLKWMHIQLWENVITPNFS